MDVTFVKAILMYINKDLYFPVNIDIYQEIVIFHTLARIPPAHPAPDERADERSSEHAGSTRVVGFSV